MLYVILLLISIPFDTILYRFRYSPAPDLCFLLPRISISNGLRILLPFLGGYIEALGLNLYQSTR